MCKSSDTPTITGILISTRGESPESFARSLRDAIHGLFLLVAERRTLDLEEDETYSLHLLTSICKELESPHVVTFK